jgi:hypothetical protein
MEAGMTWTRTDLLQLSKDEERFVREVPDLEGRGPITHLLHIGQSLLCLRGLPVREITGPEMDVLAAARFEPLQRKPR